MPRLVVLIGYQAVGKSTYAAQLEKEGYRVISGDRVLEELKEKYGLPTIDAVYDSHRAELNEIMNNNLSQAVANGESIVTDSFNLTKRHRARCLHAVRDSTHNYTCTAIIFHPPEAGEHARRIMNRVFPGGLLNSADGLRMTQLEDSYEPPSREEGFTEIVTIGKPPNEPLMVMR